MKRFQQICVGVLLLPGALWAQQPDTTPAPPVPAVMNANIGDDQAPAPLPVSGDQMLTPPPVSGQSYPTSFSSGERSNYLRGGLAFTTAYTDNALPSASGQPVSDVSYSVAPFLALDETTPRLHWVLTYAPGFTFYQRLSSLNETDQNAAIDVQYRLSPHVTISARDAFQKSSNVFNQPDLGSSQIVSGGTQQPNFSVIAPIADRLSNYGNVGITYQFAANGMVGASGTFSNLHYPNPTEVPGLFDSSSQAGSAFYSYRVSKIHYIGVTYQYQRLIAYPTNGQSETQTHAFLFFYTLYATPRFSISFYGGPQHYDTLLPLQPLLLVQLPEVRSWNPAAGASMSWQGQHTNLAASYSHIVSGAGGLVGAVQMESASASIRQQLMRRLGGVVEGSYVQNNILGGALIGVSNGHTLGGTASLEQQFGQHIYLRAGYTRLHQDYSSVAVLAATPNTNREFISISYQFSRPLGR